MVHVGFEPSAVLGAHRKLGDNWKMLKWQLTGKMGGAPGKRNGANGKTNGNGHNGTNGHSTTPRPEASPDLVSADGSLRVL